MGMIQTERPYYQSVPKAPTPFRTGLFPNGPTFRDCKADDASCYISWALGTIDSSAVYVLGAGLYSWLNYSQDCLDTEDCLDAESRYNRVTTYGSTTSVPKP